MAREHAAGSVVVDRLRERIVSGVYLGFWHAGERLPSIRAIADSESVDRKTVAAAYRRLEIEGLVRVHPRSGVYLRTSRFPEAAGPLERLHRRWLETTYERAGALGLDSRTILRLIIAVAETERHAIPVVECDLAQSETIASELRQRLSLNAVPCVVQGDLIPIATGAPFVITTPYHRGEIAARVSDRPIVEVTLALDTMRELRARAELGPTAIVVASDVIALKLSRAIERGQLTDSNAQVNVIVAQQAAQLAQSVNGYRALFLWPGAPTWVRDAVSNVECISPVHCLSEDSIARVRGAVLDAAIRRAHEQDVVMPFTTPTVSESQSTPVAVAG